MECQPDILTGALLEVWTLRVCERKSSPSGVKAPSSLGPGIQNCLSPLLQLLASGLRGPLAGPLEAERHPELEETAREPETPQPHSQRAPGAQQAGVEGLGGPHQGTTESQRESEAKALVAQSCPTL